MRKKIIKWTLRVLAVLLIIFLIIFAQTQTAAALKQRDDAERAERDAIAQRDAAEVIRQESEERIKSLEQQLENCR